MRINRGNLFNWLCGLTVGLFIIETIQAVQCQGIEADPNDWFYKSIQHPLIEKPTDILFLNGRYITTEHLSHRLSIFRNFRLTDPRQFDPASIGKAFVSPHFLAIAPDGRLLVSNGRGTNIVSMSDTAGADWRTFQGVGTPLNAPHGIAVAPDGWIYVGDSGNSRIVRFRNMEGQGWQVFADVENKVAYTRQLVWKDDALWVSNTYEGFPGMNPGRGGNVLRIRDFNSGLCDIVYQKEDSHLTGILPLENSLLVALWGNDCCVMEVDLKMGIAFFLPETRCALGVPYGLYEDKRSGSIIVCYFGELDDSNNGGLLLMRRALPFPPGGVFPSGIFNLLD